MQLAGLFWISKNKTKQNTPSKGILTIAFFSAFSVTIMLSSSFRMFLHIKSVIFWSWSLLPDKLSEKSFKSLFCFKMGPPTVMSGKCSYSISKPQSDIWKHTFWETFLCSLWKVSSNVFVYKLHAENWQFSFNTV